MDKIINNKEKYCTFATQIYHSQKITNDIMKQVFFEILTTKVAFFAMILDYLFPRSTPYIGLSFKNKFARCRILRRRIACKNDRCGNLIVKRGVLRFFCFSKF